MRLSIWDVVSIACLAVLFAGYAFHMLLIAFEPADPVPTLRSK